MRVLSQGKKVKSQEAKTHAGGATQHQPTNTWRRWCLLICIILSLGLFLGKEVWGSRSKMRQRQERRRLSEPFRKIRTGETPQPEHSVAPEREETPQPTELTKEPTQAPAEIHTFSPTQAPTQAPPTHTAEPISVALPGSNSETDQHHSDKDTDTEPAICASLKNTAALRALWHSTKGSSYTAPPLPQYCSASEEVPSVRKEHMRFKNPVTEVAQEGGFAKQDVTLETMKTLRRKGMIEQLYIDEELKLMYCAVPKAGCTGMKAWMIQNTGHYNGGTVHNRALYKGPRLFNAQFLPNGKLLDMFLSGEYFKFTVVRNPYTRILATFLERFHKCEEQPKRDSGECRVWKNSLVNYRGVLPGVNVTFTEVLELMKKYPSEKIDFKNAHWLPSVTVCGLDVLHYDWVGKLEDADDAAALYSLTGTKPLAPQYQRGAKHSVGTSSKLDLYTDAALQLVFELYNATDLTTLGYNKDSVFSKIKTQPVKEAALNKVSEASEQTMNTDHRPDGQQEVAAHSDTTPTTPEPHSALLSTGRGRGGLSRGGVSSRGGGDVQLGDTANEIDDDTGVLDDESRNDGDPEELV